MSFPILAETQIIRLDKGMEMVSDCQILAEKAEEVVTLLLSTVTCSSSSSNLGKDSSERVTLRRAL